MICSENKQTKKLYIRKDNHRFLIRTNSKEGNLLPVATKKAPHPQHRCPWWAPSTLYSTWCTVSHGFALFYKQLSKPLRGPPGPGPGIAEEEGKVHPPLPVPTGKG
jgi:hypothetical protein